MITGSNKKDRSFSRLCQWRNLLFFVIAVACNQRPHTSVVVNLTNGKAISVTIPAQLVAGVPGDSLSQLVQVRLKDDTTASSIWGEFSKTQEIIFSPLLAFSRGSVYEIFVRNKKIDSFLIPPEDRTTPTQLTGIYPALDTVPENLLKIYFRFSRPMQEGRSARYIKIIRNNKDTLPDVFLDLQPELWNEDRTVLTLWLDPGRIKRDLQPNLRLGSPLKRNDSYTVLVLGEWKDARALPIQKNYTHSFIAGNRDSLGPDPDKWKIADTIISGKRSFRINLTEVLDHFLLTECLSLLDEHKKTVQGNFIATGKDGECVFMPVTGLMKGKYALKIQTRLEDLAGNNINRPFDRDTKKSKQPSTATSFHKYFIVN